MATIDKVKCGLHKAISQAEFEKAVNDQAEEYAIAGADPDRVLAEWEESPYKLTEIPAQRFTNLNDPNMQRSRNLLYFDPDEILEAISRNVKPDSHNDSQVPTAMPYNIPMQPDKDFPINVISELPRKEIDLNIIKTLEGLLGNARADQYTSSEVKVDGGNVKSPAEKASHYPSPALEAALVIALAAGYLSRNMLRSAYTTIRGKADAAKQRIGMIAQGFLDDTFSGDPSQAFVNRITAAYAAKHVAKDVKPDEFKGYVQLFLRRAEGKRGYSLPEARAIVELVMEYAQLPGKTMETLKQANQEAIRKFVYSLPEKAKPKFVK